MLKPRSQGSFVFQAPQAGQLLDLDHQAWRVIAVHANDADTRIRLDVRLDRDGPGESTHQVRGRASSWRVLDEHYSVCHRCGDLQPCREQRAEYEAGEAAREVTRYETAGICPACLEPVTLRQKTITFDVNTIAPLGPPVTFHLRWKCLRAAARYERHLSTLLPAPMRAPLTLSCAGILFTHRDGAITCTHTDCPGPTALHDEKRQCRYLSHGCPRLECELLTPGVFS